MLVPGGGGGAILMGGISELDGGALIGGAESGSGGGGKSPGIYTTEHKQKMEPQTKKRYFYHIRQGKSEWRW